MSSIIRSIKIFFIQGDVFIAPILELEFLGLSVSTEEFGPLLKRTKKANVIAGVTDTESKHIIFR